jgi:hypothetical protein
LKRRKRKRKELLEGEKELRLEMIREDVEVKKKEKILF